MTKSKITKNPTSNQKPRPFSNLNFNFNLNKIIKSRTNRAIILRPSPPKSFGLSKLVMQVEEMVKLVTSGTKGVDGCFCAKYARKSLMRKSKSFIRARASTG